MGVGHYRILFDWESTIKTVSLMVDRVTPIRAWLEYLDLTQEEAAKRLGISLPAYAQQESVAKPRTNPVQAV